jgi:hypothetical protein
MTILYTTFNCQEAPLGAWVLLEIPDNNGQPIAQVRNLKIDQLFLPELNEKLELPPEKKKYLVDYVLKLKAGGSPPLIEVIEMENGISKVIDGQRRVLAAAAMGFHTIKGLYSPLVDVPGKGLQGMTLELLQSGQYKDDYLMGKRYYRGHELKILKSAAGFYIGSIDSDGYPLSRVSEEYWPKAQQAEKAFGNDTYTTRESWENHYTPVLSAASPN